MVARLHRYCAVGDLAAIRACLADGDTVDERGKGGRTPTMVAASCGFIEVIEEMILAGADLDLEDNRGETALGIALSAGRDKVVYRLVVDGRGRRPGQIWSAGLFGGRDGLFEKFVAEGYDPDFVGPDGISAREHAEGGASSFSGMSEPGLSEESVRKMMDEYESADEYLAHHGRRVLIASFKEGYPDPAVQAWVKRFMKVMENRELLAEVEERFLSGEELSKAQQLAANERRRDERDAKRRGG